MRYVWATGTHKGMARSNNEDAVFPETAGESEGPAVLIVADGMGGHVAGEVASGIAIKAAAAAGDLAPGDRIAAGNRALREEVARDPELDGMGTTMTLVSLEVNGRATVGHVGDSRAYLTDGTKMIQLTQDHTLAANYAAAGRISEEEAATHPQRHVLTRTLGLTRFVNVDEVDVSFEPGDRLLLCSDGLNEMASDADIQSALTEGSVEEAVWSLIDMANDAGGVDNITVIVIEVLD